MLLVGKKKKKKPKKHAEDVPIMISQLVIYTPWCTVVDDFAHSQILINEFFLEV